MKKAPYTLAEARELLSEYQYLLGQSFDREEKFVIDCVTIAPFEEAARQRFLIFYFLLNNAESALAQEYKGLLYHVLVIGRSKEDKHDLRHEELQMWLAENKPVAARIQTEG